MLGFASCSQPPHKPTPGPRRLIVPSCRRWKHMTILRMVIIVIIALFAIISIITIITVLLFALVVFSGWLESVGSRILYKLDYRKLVLYVIQYRVSWENCKLYPSMTLGLFHTNFQCATSFRARPSTAGRVPDHYR
jgi:hypothetical protein